MEIRADGSETVVRSKRPEPLTTSVKSPAGQLVVESNIPMPQLTVRGANSPAKHDAPVQKRI